MMYFSWSRNEVKFFDPVDMLLLDSIEFEKRYLESVEIYCFSDKIQPIRFSFFHI